MGDAGRFCENCGAELRTDQRFCEACGHSIANSDDAPSQPTEVIRPQPAVEVPPPATGPVSGGRRGPTRGQMLFGIGAGLVVVVLVYLFSSGQLSALLHTTPTVVSSSTKSATAVVANSNGSTPVSSAGSMATPNVAKSTALPQSTAKPTTATAKPTQTPAKATPTGSTGLAIADLAGDWKIISSFDNATGSNDEIVGQVFSLGMSSDGRLQRTSKQGVIPEAWEEVDGIETVDVFLDLKKNAAGKFSGKLVAVDSAGNDVLQLDVTYELSSDRQQLTVTEKWPSETITSVSKRQSATNVKATPTKTSSGVSQSTSSAKAVKAVQAALDAWNVLDEEAFVASFMEDQREDLAEEMLILPDNTLTFTSGLVDDPVQSVNGGLIVVRAHFDFTYRDGTKETYLADFDMVSVGGSWLISYVRGVDE